MIGHFKGGELKTFLQATILMEFSHEERSIDQEGELLKFPGRDGGCFPALG